MSKGNPQAGGSTSGFGSQGQFGTGYTQPYGSPSGNLFGQPYGGPTFNAGPFSFNTPGYGAGTYDPMLGFGQASGMGTTYNYPTRYTADYTRYAQSGQPFNPAVMGYNSYGQIFAQPQRPPPSMGKGGGGFQPQPPAGGGKGRVGTPRVPRGGTGNFLDFYTRQNNPANSIFEPGFQPPAMGGKGGGGFQPGYGYQPQFPGMVAGGPGFEQINRRRPERRTNQLGLNQPPQKSGVPGSFLDFYSRQNNLPEPPLEAEPAPIVDMNQEFRSYPGDSGFVSPDIANSPFGQLIGQPAAQPTMAQQGANISNPDRDRVREITTRSFNNPESITAEDMAFLQEYDARPSDTQAQLAAQQQLLAQQQQISNSAPPGMMRNPNYSPTSSMLDNVAMSGSDDYLRRQAFIPADGGFGRMYFQEGGQVPPDAASNMELMLSEAGPANPQAEMAGEYDRLIQMTMQAVLGQTENADEIIQMFIDEFGVDAFRQLRDAVLKQQVPNAQTEGMVDGNGGGMDDQVMGMIGNQRPVAVSPGEYIVPADVVSGLGDGSSKAGADMLDELNQAVRMARTGTAEQPRPLMETLQ